MQPGNSFILNLSAKFKVEPKWTKFLASRREIAQISDFSLILWITGCNRIAAVKRDLFKPVQGKTVSGLKAVECWSFQSITQMQASQGKSVLKSQSVATKVNLESQESCTGLVKMTQCSYEVRKWCVISSLFCTVKDVYLCKSSDVRCIPVFVPLSHLC